MSTLDTRPVRPYWSMLVRPSPILRLVALFIFSLFGGISINEVDYERSYRIPAYFPTNAAFRVFGHIGQRRVDSAKTNLLPKYDFGAKQNLLVYGQPVPPSYDLGKVTNRYNILFRGLNDFLADYRDLERLKMVLGVPFLKEFRTDYAHTDVVFGRTANVSVNLPVLRVLHQLRLNYH